MPFPQFLLFTFIGAYLWCSSIIGLGFVVGHEWSIISVLVGRFTPWAVAGFVTLGGMGLMTRWLIQRRLRLQPVFVKTDENE